MIVPAIAEIGADAESATHRTPMHAGDRQRRERTANDGVSLGYGGRDAVKGEGQRSQDQRSTDEKLLHDPTPLISTEV
jgi:hypothetical protein